MLLTGEDAVNWLLKMERNMVWKCFCRSEIDTKKPTMRGKFLGLDGGVVGWVCGVFVCKIPVPVQYYCV
jgi:hypothetical protein